MAAHIPPSLPAWVRRHSRLNGAWSEWSNAFCNKKRLPFLTFPDRAASAACAPFLTLHGTTRVPKKVSSKSASTYTVVLMTCFRKQPHRHVAATRFPVRGPGGVGPVHARPKPLPANPAHLRQGEKQSIATFLLRMLSTFDSLNHRQAALVNIIGIQEIGVLAFINCIHITLQTYKPKNGFDYLSQRPSRGSCPTFLKDFPRSLQTAPSVLQYQFSGSLRSVRLSRVVRKLQKFAGGLGRSPPQLWRSQSCPCTLCPCARTSSQET